MENNSLVELKNFYKEWEKHAFQFVTPLSQVKSNFDLLNNPQFKLLMASSPVVTFIINHINSRYEFFSENAFQMTGYTAQEFIEGGVPFGMSITDENQTSYLTNFLLPQVFEHIEMFKQLGELNKIRLGYNYRIKRKDGIKIWTLHLMTILETDESGGPLLTMVHMIDITNFKKDERVDFSLSKLNEQGYYHTIALKSYPNTESDELLSEREIEILHLLVKGKESKEIADSLFLSIHTVHTHRRNMLKKTGCKNSFELVNYGISRGLAVV